jgi:PAS domain S-box-containing protein
MDKRKEQSQTWAGIKEFGLRVASESTNAENLQHEGDKKAANLQWLKVSAMLDKLFRLCDELSVEQLEKQNTIRHEILQHQQMVRMSLWAMVLVSLVLVVAMALTFGARTRRRILILADNTARLATGKALNEPLTGDDDLVTLDQTFRRISDELAVMRRKERALLENAAEVICSLDAGGTITNINTAATQLWGYSSEEMTSASFSSFLPAEEKSSFEANLKRTQEKDEHSSTFDCGVATKAGSIAICAFSVTWSPQEESYYCVVHDVTEKKEMERLKADFVAMVSHDLRAPLTAVMMTNEILLDSDHFGQLNEGGLKGMERSQQSLQRLMSLVNSLLDIEKIEAGRMELLLETVTLKDIAESSIDAVSALAEQKTIQTKIEIASELTAYADREKTIQVLVNLLSNAIKFSEAEQVVTVSASASGDEVIIKVSDQGRGIPADKISEVFDRFKQVKLEDGRKKGGTGLGLAICKSIIELHGGKVGVESEEAKGSTFWFSLPANVTKYRSSQEVA